MSRTRLRESVILKVHFSSILPNIRTVYSCVGKQGTEYKVFLTFVCNWLPPTGG